MCSIKTKYSYLIILVISSLTSFASGDYMKGIPVKKLELPSGSSFLSGEIFSDNKLRLSKSISGRSFKLNKFIPANQEMYHEESIVNCKELIMKYGEAPFDCKHLQAHVVDDSFLELGLPKEERLNKGQTFVRFSKTSVKMSIFDEKVSAASFWLYPLTTNATQEGLDVAVKRARFCQKASFDHNFGKLRLDRGYFFKSSDVDTFEDLEPCKGELYVSVNRTSDRDGDFKMLLQDVPRYLLNLSSLIGEAENGFIISLRNVECENYPFYFKINFTTIHRKEFPYWTMDLDLSMFHMDKWFDAQRTESVLDSKLTFHQKKDPFHDTDYNSTLVVSSLSSVYPLMNFYGRKVFVNSANFKGKGESFLINRFFSVYLDDDWQGESFKQQMRMFLNTSIDHEGEPDMEFKYENEAEHVAFSFKARKKLQALDNLGIRLWDEDENEDEDDNEV